MERPDIEVDARGLWCPLPVLRLARALSGKAVGSVARLSATDPAVGEDVAVFCREGGHELVESRRDADVFTFLVRKGPT